MRQTTDEEESFTEFITTPVPWHLLFDLAEWSLYAVCFVAVLIGITFGSVVLVVTCLPEIPNFVKRLRKIMNDKKTP